MIVVIADDLTGAAELAGIGLRCGLRARVCMEVPGPGRVETGAGEELADRGEPVAGPVELLVIATDTRSMRRAEAVEETLRLIKEVLRLRPEWVYKKTDSVLRGHVMDELVVQMEVLGMEKTLLVPANPGLGRTIKGGRYYIDGVPVHETSFFYDPEFPVKSPEVWEMLGGVLDGRIVVEDVETAGDLYNLAGRIDEKTLAAGGAEFFTALLGRDEVVRNTAEEMRRPILLVSGTAFRKSREMIGQVEGDVVRLLREEGKAIVSGWPKGDIAEQVRRVLAEVAVHELVIEGGATAYAVLRASGLTSFVPVEELAPGVVRMRAGEMYITVKPGSYEWPEKILTI